MAQVMRKALPTPPAPHLQGGMGGQPGGSGACWEEGEWSGVALSQDGRPDDVCASIAAATNGGTSDATSGLLDDATSSNICVKEKVKHREGRPVIAR